MASIYKNTILGLGKRYFFRHFFFGFLMFILIMLSVIYTNEFKNTEFSIVVISIISTFLYPYSRFVYESVVNFIRGNNVIYVSFLYLLLGKFITISMCWTFSIFLAPIGLVYLYFHHSSKS